jgi:hypothetical protein
MTNESRQGCTSLALYGYAEGSSHTFITTKGTKDTKRKGTYAPSFLRDLLALRGAKTLIRIDWNFLDNRVVL